LAQAILGQVIRLSPRECITVLLHQVSRAMKIVSAVALALVGVQAVQETSPISKVIQMLSDLHGKVTKEGETSKQLFQEFSEWCEDRSANLGHEIKTGQSEARRLSAAIAQEEATSAGLNAKIEDLVAAIGVDTHDLDAARAIRDVEQKDFAASESELSDIISMLERAVGILEREMAKGGSSMLQLQNVQGVAQALTVMVKASVMSSADVTRLTALLQNTQKSDDADEDVGAPAAAVYKSQSGDIVETLRNLKDEAEKQLDDARKTETENHHNFMLMQQGLEDEIRFGNKDMADAKKALAASSESKSSAQGDLSVVSKELAADQNTAGTVHQDCTTKAENYAAEVNSRNEELKALADATKVLEENVGGATSISYGAAFVQLSQSSLKSSSDLANFEVARLVRDLASKENSPALAQLAQRISSAMSSGSRIGDPFVKVKGLVSDMITRLEAEASADASHKAYCDKQLRETNVKKSEKTSEIQKQTIRIDRMNARSAILKDEVAALQKALADLAASQSEMDKIRRDENAAYVSNRADMEQGLTGVKMALKILSEYYANEDKDHEEASGAGKSIISLLEVVESDFAKDLAEIVSTEESAVSAYETTTKDNQIERATKDKAVEYKTKEHKYLDKESADLTADRSGVQAELDAVLEYLGKIEEQCIEKAETFAERKRRFEAEIAGLKEALNILESETSLVQRRSRHHRGSKFMAM